MVRMVPWTLPSWASAPSSGLPRKTVILNRGESPRERRFDIEKACYTLGREKQDVDLTGLHTSRVHAAIFSDIKGELYVCDLKSTHGTWIGHHRLEPYQGYPWDGTRLIFGFAQHGEPGCMDVACWEPQERRPKRMREEVSAEMHGVALADAQGAQQPMASQVASVSGPWRRDPIHTIQIPRARLSGSKTASEPRSLATSDNDVPEPQAKYRQVSSAQARGRSDGSAGRCYGPELPPVPAKTLLIPLRASHERASSANTTPGPLPATSARSAPSKGAAPSKKCDKCDGPHPTDACPHFKKGREEHKDAWVNYGKKAVHQMGSSGGNVVLKHAHVQRQPGDGSCLFHSLCAGLGLGARAGELRRDLASFIRRNPQTEISGDTIEEWVRWDANTTCSKYAQRMEVSGWGGGIEMAVCSLLKKVNVHVYEKRGGAFQRISCFDHPDAKKTVHVLYQGGVHYDALVPAR